MMPSTVSSRARLTDRFVMGPRHECWEWTFTKAAEGITTLVSERDTLQAQVTTLTAKLDEIRGEWESALSREMSTFAELKERRDQITVLEGEQKELRELLWLRHGCSLASLYGDDGEMQCSAHHPSIDFKRQSLADITRGMALHVVKAKEPLEAQVTTLTAEVERLTADIQFKDGLIWTSRESELYKATVAAEKRADKAEAEAAQRATQWEALKALVEAKRARLALHLVDPSDVVSIQKAISILETHS